MRYKADITAGSLKVSESRIIADLLLQGVNKQAWDEAVLVKNILQTRSSETARRLARLIRKRLQAMGADLWKLVRDGSGEVTTHAVLAAAIKHSPLPIVDIKGPFVPLSSPKKVKNWYFFKISHDRIRIRGTFLLPSAMH